MVAVTNRRAWNDSRVNPGGVLGVDLKGVALPKHTWGGGDAGRCLAESGPTLPKSPTSGRMRPKLGPHRPELVKIGSNSAKSGPTTVNLCQNRPALG